jgi:hypothetical protein
MAMKFLPVGYLAISEAFYEFCENHADVVEAAKRKPDERKEPKEYLKWVGTEHQAAMNNAVSNFVGLFSAGDLNPIVLHDDKELAVPDDYWRRGFADLTLLSDGRLCGLATDDEYPHLDGCPVVLLREQWEAWKTDPTPRRKEWELWKTAPALSKTNDDGAADVRSAQPSPPPNAHKVPTKKQTEDWYKARVKQLQREGVRPSREDDEVAAKEEMGISRPRARELRKRFAPVEWQDAGRPRESGEK